MNTLLNTNNNNMIEIDINDRHFLKMIGKDCENIILDYVFQLEYDDRVRDHKNRFVDCLEQIRNKKHMETYDMLLGGLDWNDSYDWIEVEFDFIEDDIEITENIRIENMNRWVGFNGDDLLNDLLFNYNRMDDYDGRKDYIFQGMEEWEDEDDEDDDEYNKYSERLNDEYTNMEMISDVIGEIFFQYPIDEDDFKRYISGEL